MAWLTGHDGWSFYVHQCVVVPVDEQPLWYGRRQDAKGALRAVYMAETRILGYPDHDIQTRERHPMDHLSAVLRDRGLAKGTLGVEMDNYYLSATADAAADAALRHYLPDAWRGGTRPQYIRALSKMFCISPRRPCR